MPDFGVTTPEEAATQAIRDYCGWHVAPRREEILVLDGTGTDTVLLPSRRVASVSLVELRGEPLPSESFEWSEGGQLKLLGGVWPDVYRCIKVTLEHGFDSEHVLADLVASVAARIKIDQTGMVTNQRAGTQAVSFGGRQASGGGGHGLLNMEKDLLAPYRLTWGP